jgi:ribose transport system substrate-binding protein
LIFAGAAADDDCIRFGIDLEFDQPAHAGTSFCDEDIAKGVTETENVLRSHPDLIGFIIVGAWPLLASPGALPRLTSRAKAGLKVVGFDYVAQELPFIQNGTVAATVGQDYWGWGYQSVQILYNLIKGKKYPDFVPQRIPVVDQSNVASYVEKWKNADTVEGAFKAFGEPPVQPLA